MNIVANRPLNSLFRSRNVPTSISFALGNIQTLVIRLLWDRFNKTHMVNRTFSFFPLCVPVQLSDILSI